MGGVHTNANKKNKRFELSKRRVREAAFRACASALTLLPPAAHALAR